ncbi:hypothetical protein WBG78_28590 [Chryseolinea sp. T2]|uniref:hypothetical protein n=1 Tax=Chryseolinea sp. T2 TaxID=3129255 RepID=UPI0030771792
MNIPRLSCSLLSAFILFSSCDEDAAKYKEPQLSGYVDRFIEQASLHGQDVSADKWTVEFGEVEGNFCGVAEDLKVIISEDCWNKMPESGREALMFHELGHALLGRSHKNERLPNGDFASLMTEDPTMLYSAYTPLKRLYYFEELFNESTSPPVWSLPKTNATVIFKDTIKLDNGWQFKLSGSPNHSQSINSSVFVSPSSSLQITSAGTGSGYSYWTYFIIPENIPEGTPVDVRVKIKTEHLNGDGANIIVRGDVAGDNLPAFVYSTHETTSMVGTDDFVEYGVKYPTSRTSSIDSVSSSYYPAIVRGRFTSMMSK